MQPAAQAPVAMAAAVVAKPHAVTVAAMAAVAVAPIVVATSSNHARRVPAPRKTAARAVMAAVPSSSRPQASPTKVAHRALLRPNLTPCAPASI